MQCQFTLESSNLKYYHCFNNNKICKCILSVLNTSKDKNNWLNRSDVFYDCEVYYIQERIYTLSQMDCYFEINIKSVQNPKQTQLNAKFKQNVESLALSGTDNYAKFARVEITYSIYTIYYT